VVAVVITSMSPAAADVDDVGVFFRPTQTKSLEYGAMIDAGLPDGITASLIYRPDPQLRFHLGGSHNMISSGIRTGMTILMRRGWFSPSLSFEYGHYFAGDANPLLRRLTGDDSWQIPALQRVGYDFGNAHLGIELGSKRVTFYLHVGMSFLETTVYRVTETIADEMPPAPDGPVLEVLDNPEIFMLFASARTGLILYF